MTSHLKSRKGFMFSLGFPHFASERRIFSPARINRSLPANHFGKKQFKRISLGIFRLDSPRPFNLTNGRDKNFDSVLNDRPAGVERNSLRGDWSKQFDVNLSRQFKVKKESANKNSPFNFLGQKLTISLSIQNLFNQTNRQGFVGNQLSPFYLQPTSALPARTVQLRLAYSF